MNSIKPLWIVIVGVLATAAFSMISLAERYRIESRNKATLIAVELSTIAPLAAAENMSLADGIERLKRAGVGGGLVSQQSVGELIDDGMIQLRSGSNGEVSITSDKETVARIQRGLWVRFGKPETPKPDPVLATEMFLLRDIAPGLVRNMSIGLDPALAKLAAEQKLQLIARGDNPAGADRDTIRETIAWFHELGASVFLPEGEQVLGRRDNLETLTEALKSNEMLYASPEFAKIGGDLNVTVLVPERTVRLHSAQTAELDKLRLPEAVERYAKAASERSIRILLIRPLANSNDRPLTALAEFIEALKRRLERENLEIGAAHPFEEPQVPRWVFPLIGISAAVVAIWAAALFFSSSLVLGFIALVSLCVGAGAWMPEIRSYTALMAAMAFPIAAYGVLMGTKHRSIWLHYVVMVLISVVGGLAVAGLLNALPYFIRAEQFEGVKLAHFGPIFLAGLFLAMQMIDWRGGLKNPITWMQALLSLFLLVALAFMFLRTGNDNPAAVSGFELRLRSLLDAILPVRPRTKEFMLGYPALIIGLGLLMQVRSGRQGEAFKGWAVLALMVGAIALTSVVNTMCHLHTPLDVGLIRIVVGFVLGGIIGGIAWAVLRYCLPRTQA